MRRHLQRRSRDGREKGCKESRGDSAWGSKAVTRGALGEEAGPCLSRDELLVGLLRRS